MAYETGQQEKKRILIIEDDSAIASLERDYLEISGYDVRVAGSWAQAREMLADGVDLFLLDIMLPGADGTDILKELRNAHNVDVPVIIVSAKETDADKILGLGLGADDYLVKPFSPSELVARVKAHIVRYGRLTARASGELGASGVGMAGMAGAPGSVGATGAGAARDTVSIRHLAIDIPARRVFVRGRETKLTNKEFELLLFFVRHPNRVFRKDEIFDRVWGMDSLGDASTVTVHVNKLREKIADTAPPENGVPRLIETVWGAGYRFRV